MSIAPIILGFAAGAVGGAAGGAPGHYLGFRRGWTLAVRLNHAVFDPNAGFGRLEKLSDQLKAEDRT